MALDPNKLSRNELVQLLNSTALGESITRSRLDRQMNRAGRRWHDGRHVRLLDYLRWLVREVERPAKPKIDGRAADLERKNTETWRTQNIAPLPDIADMARRERARADFRFFCETYFASALYRSWSEDHLRVIEKIERAVKEGGLFAFAMPRGSGKTTLARLSALWAILSGYRPFVCLIGGSQERAVELLAPIRKAVLENPLLRPMVNEGEMSFSDIEAWAGEFRTSVTSTARRAVELSDFPCGLVGVRGGCVAFSFHSQAMIEGGCYPRPRGSAMPAAARSKWDALTGGCLLDNQGQALGRDWCQTYDNDRAARAPISEHYFAVPPTQTLLVLLTIPEDELFADDEDD